MTPIRVLLAEDQAMIREALAALLSFEDDIEVVAQVGRGDEVTAAALASKPDVALVTSSPRPTWATTSMSSSNDNSAARASRIIT